MKRGHEAVEWPNTYSRADPALVVAVDRFTLGTLANCAWRVGREVEMFAASSVDQLSDLG